MLKLKTLLITLSCILFSTLGIAYEITPESQIADIKKALDTGRTANIRGVDYLWEAGVIYKIKNGQKRRTRGLKDIVKASVNPLITTNITLPKDCEQADYAQTQAIKLLKKAMALFPNARYEYAFQAGSAVKAQCLTNASQQIIIELKSGGKLDAAKVTPETLWLDDDALVLHLLRSR